MRFVFYVITVQLLVAVCLVLLMSKPIELCGAGVFDRLLLDKNSACHHASILIMHTLHVPWSADDNGTFAPNSRHQISDDAPLDKREPDITTRVCWTLGFEERFCRGPNDACFGLTAQLVALFAIAIIIVAILVQMAVTVRSLAPPTRRAQMLRSLLMALLWLVAAASNTVLCMQWSDGWKKHRLQPAFPREWLVALVLSWVLMIESTLEVFCGDALHMNVRFARLTGRYNLVKNGNGSKAETVRRY